MMPPLALPATLRRTTDTVQISVAGSVLRGYVRRMDQLPGDVAQSSKSTASAA